MMNRNKWGMIAALAASLGFSGCSSETGEKANDNKSANTVATQNVNAAGSTSVTESAANVAPANVAAPPTGVTGSDATQTNVAGSGSTRANSNAVPQANMPKPQIGSGGKDFSMFMQARGAIVTDPDLKTANVIIDVKDGVVTLSGTVASAAQKSKAEQLVRTVNPRDVKNQLRVSAGK